MANIIPMFIKLCPTCGKEAEVVNSYELTDFELEFMDELEILAYQCSCGERFYC